MADGVVMGDAVVELRMFDWPVASCVEGWLASANTMVVRRTIRSVNECAVSLLGCP